MFKPFITIDGRTTGFANVEELHAILGCIRHKQAVVKLHAQNEWEPLYLLKNGDYAVCQKVSYQGDSIWSHGDTFGEDEEMEFPTPDGRFDCFPGSLIVLFREAVATLEDSFQRNELSSMIRFVSCGL